jgi:PAS domain S-box-containing protein
MPETQEVTILPAEDDLGHARLIEKNLRRSNLANDIVAVNEGDVRLYGEIVSNMQMGLQVYQLEKSEDDRSLKMIATNPAATLFTGLAPEDAVGKMLDEIFPGLRKRGIPQIYADVVRSGIPVELEQEVGYDENGTLDAWWSIRAFPLPDHCVGVLFEDITLKKQTEESLRRNKIRYQAMLEDQTDLICRALPDGTLTFVNKAYCRYFDQKREVLIGRSLFLPIPEADQAEVQKQFASLSLENPVAHFEHGVTGPDGEIRWLAWTRRAIFDDQGHRVELLSVGRDITERKRAEEQLQQYAADLERANADVVRASEEVKQFAYIVSHDLRVPLVNLKGFAAELRTALGVIEPAMDTLLPQLDERQRQTVSLALHEDVPEAMEFIESSVNRMDQLINAILKLSRLGRRELRFEPVDVNAIVQATLDSLTYQLEEHQVAVTVGPLPQVVADRTAMEQIVGNLLGNAVKYLDQDRPGELEITAERNHHEVRFQIRDNGRGIAAEDMDKVFAPFRRAGRHDVPGEGMGLPYVQTLVRRHGGRIWYESEPGVETTFTFTISNHPEVSGSGYGTRPTPVTTQAQAKRER